MLRSKRLAAGALVVLVVAAFAWHPVQGYVAASRLLFTLTTGPAGDAIGERDLTVTGSRGPIRARLYYPRGQTPRRALVVAHGVHYRGIDEKRLLPFARGLAAQGFAVLTPELGDLVDYRITTLGLDVITDSVRFMSENSPLRTAAADVGILGFSFAGGLGLVAAAQSVIRDRVAYVVSVGGHHDLGRVMRFLVTDRVEAPDGSWELDAHEYGLVVAVYGLIDHFVPGRDRQVMREALRCWLQEDRGCALAFASQRTSSEAEELFRRVETGRLGEFRGRLLDLLEANQTELERLSPHGKLGRIGAPVYLLHGSGDTVIPPAESQWADAELAGKAHRALISPLLEHVAVDRPAGWADRLALVNFMAQLF